MWTGCIIIDQGSFKYRFYLSILVGSCIIGTLAGTNLLGPASHTTISSKRLHRIDQTISKGSLGGLTTKGAKFK